MKAEHGGDLWDARQVYTGELLDFSVNLNPLGAPKPVIQAAAAAALRPEAYPDPFCRELRRAIGRMEQVPEELIFCGNGASEVIDRLVRALKPGRAVITAPTFSEYRRALDAVGCETVQFLLQKEKQFDLGPEILQDMTSEVDLVLLCSPNNPTGRLLSSQLIDRILDRCREIGATLMVDECFLSLANGSCGLSPQLIDEPNLVLLRAFTKSYAIPGLRLGYCLCGNRDLVMQMEELGPCWNVSGPAQAAGIACCLLPDWPARGRALLATERPFLQWGLKELGLTVIPGEANFLLFRCTGVFDLKEQLLQRGILIRSCQNYSGLGKDWYRVAVKRREENMKLLDALEACLCQR